MIHIAGGFRWDRVHPLLPEHPMPPAARCLSRRLTDPADLQAFVDAYNTRVGRDIYRPETLDGMEVRGFWHRGELVAGYAINVRAPFHYLERIPEEDRPALPVFDRPDPRFAEVRGLWIQRRAPDVVRAWVYCRSVLDCAKYRPDWILGGTSVEAARRTQQRAVPRPLWSGELELWGERCTNWYTYGSPAECVLRLPYATIAGWLERLRRQAARLPAVRALSVAGRPFRRRRA